MANLSEKLQRLYPEQPKGTKESWIPKRDNRSVQEKLRAEMEKSQSLSQHRTEEMLLEERLLEAMQEEILQAVEVHLIEKYGNGDLLTDRLDHFTESYEHMLEKHGALLIWALAELVPQMNFVNHAGFIIKELVKDKIKELTKRAKQR